MKVLRKQTNSHMCIICGMENEASCKAPFYEMENNTLISLFSFKKEHQSYPERTHGGMITSMLDEIIGRAIWIFEPDTWGVTIEINVKYRKAVPYDTPLKAIAKITENGKRIFKGEAKILDQNNNILSEAKATYFKLPLSQIVSEKSHEDINLYIEDNVKEIN